MHKISIKEIKELVKRHKIFTAFSCIVMYTIFISLMSCFDFFTISNICFSVGVFILVIIISLLKKMWNWIEKKWNKLSPSKVDYKVELLKILLIVTMIAILVSFTSFVLSEHVQVFAGHIVEYFYPKAVQNLGDTLVNAFKKITIGEGNGGDVNKGDQEQSEYIAVNASKIMISTYTHNYKLGEMVFQTYFYEINKLYDDNAIHDILNEEIYKLYNSEQINSIEKFKFDSENIQEQEDDILNRIKDVKKYQVNSTKWRADVPTSDDLYDVCKKREELIERGLHTYRFCFLLSNDYQMLGDEYLKVSMDDNEPFEDYDTVLYFYLQSIDADKMALKFSDTPEERRTCLNRIAMRYQDIASIEGIDVNIRNAAKIISSQIKADLKYGF